MAIRRVGGATALIIMLALVGCAGSRSGFNLPPGAAADDPLTPARAELASGNEVNAIAKLTRFLQENPGSALVDEANYLLGRAYLAQRDRVLAADYFERVLRDYPQSRFAADASFHLGVAYDEMSRPSQLDQDWTDKAIRQYRGFTTSYPNRPESATAAARVKELENKLARKDYENGVLYLKLHTPNAAIVYFQKCLDDHPESDWACRAALGLGEAYLKTGHWSQAKEQLEKTMATCPNEGDQTRARKLLDKAREWLTRYPPSPADTLGSANTVATP